MDTHCKIGRVRPKGPRNITTRLPAKFMDTTKKLIASTGCDPFRATKQKAE